MMNVSDMVPLFDKVLVRMDPVEERTQGGIILPDKEKDRQNFGKLMGTVVKMGEFAFRVPNETTKIMPKVGDRVLCHSHAGDLHEVDGVSYRLMCDRDIAAIMEVS